MRDSDTVLFEVAEASARHMPLDPGELLVESPSHLLFIGDRSRPDGSLVQRVRAGSGEVAATLEQVRAGLRGHSAAGASWEVSSSATPTGLVEQLLAHGLAMADVPEATVMALDGSPPAAPDIQVRRVISKEDFKAHVTVSHTAFGKLHRLPTELARIDAMNAEELAGECFVRYTAFVADAPAGIATATFTKAGVMLHSGCTLPALRGRGVYRALVAYRWQAAVARGTPRLVTRAGPMSQPILQRLGFRELGVLRFLVDVLAS